MVSFRLSTDEYSRYRAACTLVGARNLSDLARVAMERMVSMPNGHEGSVEEQIHNLRSRIQDINLELDRLTQLVNPRRI